MVPLDVRLVREGVPWSRSAAAAFRHEVQVLEDHLLGMGVGDAELDVRVRSAEGREGDIHAVLRIGDDRLDANGEDPDLAYGLTQVLERLRGLASPERVLIDDGRGVDLGAEAPWEDVLTAVVAHAAHLVTRAIELGDLAPGVVDPRDLADDALVSVLEGTDRSMNAVRRQVRAQLERRILSEGARSDDLELDAEAEGTTPPMTDVEDDPYYEFQQPDEGPRRGEDVFDADESVDEDDRAPPRPDR